jgi:hypothetical protein
MMWTGTSLQLLMGMGGLSYWDAYCEACWAPFKLMMSICAPAAGGDA